MHAIATIEVAFAVQAGLVEPKNSLRIVQLRCQLAMIGAIQQSLSHKEQLDKQWQEDQLRVEQGKDSEWTHELSKTWWKLDKNTTYFIEVAEELVCQTGCLEGLSKPYTAEKCLRKYNAIGMKLRFFWSLSEMPLCLRASWVLGSTRWPRTS